MTGMLKITESGRLSICISGNMFFTRGVDLMPVSVKSILLAVPDHQA